MDCNNPNPRCCTKKPTSLPRRVLCEDRWGCPHTIPDIDHNGVLLYDAEGKVVSWKDGSAAFPICLDQIQELPIGSVLTHVLGLADGTCLVKIPITQEQIQTCGAGPVLTVLTTEVE